MLNMHCALCITTSKRVFPQPCQPWPLENSAVGVVSVIFSNLVIPHKKKIPVGCSSSFKWFYSREANKSQLVGLIYHGCSHHLKTRGHPWPYPPLGKKWATSPGFLLAAIFFAIGEGITLVCNHHKKRSQLEDCHSWLLTMGLSMDFADQLLQKIVTLW